MAKHNKKRNVGLIHEQLVRYVASSLIAEDKKSAETAVQIIAKHFRPGTELYREFRLFNAMVNVPVGSRSIAERILKESKRAAKNHDRQRLRQEKSLLIKDINTTMSESMRFYDLKISNYRLFATVQSLLNEWRGSSHLDYTEKAKYEEVIVEWLSRSENTQSTESDNFDPLVRKIMFEKFESKYKNQISKEQKKILETSILGSEEEFIELVKETKVRAEAALIKFKRSCENKLLSESIDDVRKNVESLPEEKSDNVVSKTLHLIHLLEEMSSNE
tara:strand:- start:783 stop:1607 length:825 start_codon:yes stop_codon:yes gene_type:complete